MPGKCVRGCSRAGGVRERMKGADEWSRKAERRKTRRHSRNALNGKERKE